MKELNLDKNDENVEKACNVAQTNYKLRNKKEEGKNMKLDKAEFIMKKYFGVISNPVFNLSNTYTPFFGK